MIWFIDDYNQHQIYITNLWTEVYMPKFPLELIVNEPYLFVNYSDSERGSGGEKRTLQIDYRDVVDSYSGYIDNPSSAADLKTQIEAMQISGWTSIHVGDLLTEKGDLLTNNGASDVILKVNADRKVLYTDLTQSTYLKWKYIEAGITTQTTDFTLALTDGFSIIEIDSGVNVEITIPENADVPFPIGTIIWIVQVDVGKPKIITDGAAVFVSPDAKNSTRTQYSTIRLQKVDTDSWEIAEDVGYAYDDDALAYFDAVEALGASFTTDEKTYINDFFVALKATGSLYAKTHYCHLYVGGTIDSIKLNIVDPVDADANHRLETTGSPTINADGVTTNGSTSYVNLNYNPSVSAAQNDKCYAFYFRSVGVASNFGALSAGFKGEFLSMDNGGTLYWALSTTSDTDAVPSPKYGFWLMNRTGSTSADLRQNDVSVDTYATATDTNINLDLYLGCRNLNGSANNLSADNFCFDWGGASLSSSEATALCNACVALQTSLGRNV